MKGYVYLLESPNCLRPYLGSTLNIFSREKDHNQGLTKSTCGKGPWKIKRFWEFEDIKQARQIEYKIKRIKVKLTEQSIENFIKQVIFN